MATLSDERWEEQTYIITPLPEGGVQVTGRSHSLRKADSTAVGATQTQAKEKSVARKTEERDSTAHRTQVEQRSNPVRTILWIWIAGIAALVAIGYLIVKHQIKKSL